VFPTKILLATNGSKESALAEAAAVELSEGTGSELHVVCVVQTVPEMPYPRMAFRERTESLLDARKLNGLRVLDGRVKQIKELGGEVAESHYREGEPLKEILRLAEELDAGLIVTGGQKRPWFERAFGAGLSELLYRRSKSPVLVVNEQTSRRSTVSR
jgi:nucleotide-binding universal stress UspA family protein